MYLRVIVCAAWVNIMLTPILGARILGIVPTPSYSHQIALHPLWKELSLRGHQVTVITTDPIHNISLTNLTEIDLHYSYQHIKTHNEKYQMPTKNFFEEFGILAKMIENLIDNELQHPHIQGLIKNESEHFDLVISEFLGPVAFLAFAEKFKCPLVGVATFDPGANTYHALGNPSHPVLNPNYKLEFSGKLTFFQRLKSSLYTLFAKYYIDAYVAPSQQRLVEKHFGDGYSNIQDTFASVSMLFVNTNPVFHAIRPLVPAVIQIGGATHLKPPEPLPKNIQDVLDNAQDGVVLFSLGTNTKSKYLSETARNTIMEAFSELPFTILWKYELDELAGKPDNVITLKWLPQQDVMRHPNVKLFITQGGLQSIEEAIYNHVPMVGMPFTRDQIYNVDKIVTSGLGLSVSYETLTKSKFKEAILEVINNERYRDSVKQFSQLLRDQPMTGLERAVWWTEYVIRHKGARHLRSPALDLPPYQYFLLDIISFCLFILIMAGLAVFFLVKLSLPLTRYFYQMFKIKIE